MSQARVERRAAWVAVIVAITLMAVKLVAYALTGSTAVFGDAMESLVNVVAALLAVWSVWMAHRPADRTHPYGHGKAEFVSAAVEGGLILAAAGAVVFKCLHEFRSPADPIERVDLGMALLGGTVVVNGIVGTWLLRTGRRGGSAALEADGTHLLADAWTSGAAILSLVLVRNTGMAWIDPAIAMAMAAWLVWNGWIVVRHALGDLMDEQDQGDRSRVEAILQRHREGQAPAICGFSQVRSRHSGREHRIDFHVQLPSATDLHTAHEVASELEREVARALAGTAMAHVEPCADHACTRCQGISVPAVVR
jgi:cation diffusion facilitator family transporter